MPQSWDMGQILSLPLRRKECVGFFKCPKNPTTRVPEASMLTTRPPKPSLFSLLHHQLSRTDTRYNIFQYRNISLTDNAKPFNFIFCKEAVTAPAIKIYSVTDVPYVHAYLFSDNTNITDWFRVLSELTNTMPLG